MTDPSIDFAALTPQQALGLASDLTALAAPASSAAGLLIVSAMDGIEPVDWLNARTGASEGCERLARQLMRLGWRHPGLGGDTDG